MQKFPVNIAAGAVLTVIGGIAMRLMHFPLDYSFGLRLAAFFLLGTALSYFVRKYNY